MRRVFLTVAIMVFASVCCLAGGVKVKEGTTAFMKENAGAVVEFDFSKTTWQEKEDFKEWCGEDYEARLVAMRESFVNSFNENSSGLKIVKAVNEAKYKIVIEVKDLERHQSFTGMWGQGKFSTTATIKVFDIFSNQMVCEIDVDGYGSGKDFNYADGLGKCYKGLAKEFVKLK
ncbi:MAG: hypothetical protein K6A98_01270 [Prevotella sp.]|nr:hypothetical protein [Prevotella sp.]